MRSSFYSVANTEQSEPVEPEPSKEIADRLKIKNILELSNQDKEVVE